LHPVPGIIIERDHFSALGMMCQGLLETGRRLPQHNNSAHFHPADPVVETSELIIGKRERNKQDKLLRIKAAARDLFISRGYDETTTREIALRAGVGMGTVFTYADNKRDLLFLIANEDLEQVTRRADANISPQKSLIDNLLAISRSHYEYFQQQPDLSKLMLREMMFYDSGQQADRFKTTREHVIAMMVRAVEFAMEAKSIRTSEPAQAVGWMLFCIYQVELRHWLAAGEAGLESGLRRLAKTLELAIIGISPAPAALQRQGRKTGKAARSAQVRLRKPF
jgi:AcrR family transcriptional regulator